MHAPTSNFTYWSTFHGANNGQIFAMQMILGNIITFDRGLSVLVQGYKGDKNLNGTFLGEIIAKLSLLRYYLQYISQNHNF